MSLKLMYITNDSTVAKIAEKSGVDRIFVDLEKVGKAERQSGLNTVQSNHSIDDILKIKNTLTKAELLVRSNPIYVNSLKEIDQIIECGADIIMLPFFKTVNEVEKFIEFVAGRAKTCILFETPEAVENIDEILSVEGIDEVYVGLNDLSLGYKKKFMFELLMDGTVEKLCLDFRLRDIPFGFGGIASIGSGMLPAECILKEHYRLGSSSVILSRSFCNYENITDELELIEIFNKGVHDIRACEERISKYSKYFTENTKTINTIIQQIINNVGIK